MQPSARAFDRTSERTHAALGRRHTSASTLKALHKGRPVARFQRAFGLGRWTRGGALLRAACPGLALCQPFGLGTSTMEPKDEPIALG